MTDQNSFLANMGKKVWWNGELIPTAEAKLHVAAHSLHYGLAAFEGIRAYELADGRLGIYRCTDHMQRFVESCHISMLPNRYSAAELVQGCKDAIKESGFRACYLRPIGFLDAGPLGVAFNTQTHPFTVAIMTMNWGKYLGADAAQKGARIKISSFARHHPNVVMTKAKMTGNYINSVYARVEAQKLGFDEALLLDPEGYVAEGSGENIFVIKKGKVYTPSVETVLEGVTRDTVMHIFKDLDIHVSERRLSRDELYAADEIFFVGTAAEITPISELDFRRVGLGRPGELTTEVASRFFDIVTGKNSKYSKWIDIV